MYVTIRYACGGCGLRWSRDFKARPAVAALFLAEGPRIVVPVDMAPCCAKGDA